jgi:hypothetical protein
MSLEAPKPGIYPNVPFEDYLEWDAVSNSSMHAAKRSMLHYYEQQPINETPAMRLGTLCHAGKFEPLMIAQRYVVMPAFENQVRKPNGDLFDSPKLSKAYKELVYDFRQANSDKIPVEQSEFDRMLGVVAALSRHGRASEYLAVRETTQVEVAIVWRDADTGLLCKGRMDCIQHDCDTVSDLKTAVDVEHFEKIILNRSYHRQGAFYVDGLAELTGEVFDFALAAIEPSRPHGIRAAKLCDDTLRSGRTEYKRILQSIAECRESKSWPGYESPEFWKLPAWAADADDEIELVIGGQKVRI